METIGLIAAMTQESDALLRLVREATHIRVGAFRAHRFDLSGQTCVLVTSGMGIRRARDAAQSLMEMGPLRFIVSFGIAGAVEADLDIGDVVASETVCQLDEKATGPLLPLTAWPEQARQAMIQALARPGARLFTGSAVTTRGSQFVQYRSADMPHPILEMETAGIAEAAAENGTPLLSLRAISDGPRTPIPINLNEMMDEDANLRAGLLLKAVVKNPGILLRSPRMLRNTRIAADNAALALVAGLGWLASNPVM